MDICIIGIIVLFGYRFILAKKTSFKISQNDLFFIRVIMSKTIITAEFQMALNFINFTNQSVFLTGRAGTGKTTLLKHIKEHSIKNLVVLAPTGVAAINAGGSTLHSFFQLPFAPFIPTSSGFNGMAETVDKHSLIAKVKLNTQRRAIINELELVIIDEISMVRPDTLDAIDTLLQHHRNKHAIPFGGVQILFIGDLLQLPPVIKNDEWRLLQPHYASPFFFESKVCANLNLTSISLQQVFRQTDTTFVDLLNKVRTQNIDDAARSAFSLRVLPDFEPPANENYIRLHTHNIHADTVNNAEINKLTTPAFSLKAVVEGEFYENNYPVEHTLVLKVGARVMFMKNDQGEERRFFNGKIGTITAITNDEVTIQCPNEKEPIALSKVVWENIRYSLNSKNQIEEDPIGTFTQFPLRLAWAITIHKSQGLTFEKAIIDVSASFAAGQMYVALSRCTTLSGLVLLSNLPTNNIPINASVLQFITHIENNPTDNNALEIAKRKFEKDNLIQQLDTKTSLKEIAKFNKLLSENRSMYDEKIMNWSNTLYSSLESIQDTYEKFVAFLNNRDNNTIAIADDEEAQTKIKGAAKYFLPKKLQLLQLVQQFPVALDRNATAQFLQKNIQLVFENLTWKVYFFNGILNGFDIAKYLDLRKQYQKPKQKISLHSKNKSSTSSLDELVEDLMFIRDQICETEAKPAYLVANRKTILLLAKHLPTTIQNIQLVDGFGPVRAQKYGPEFIAAISDYCERQNVKPNNFTVTGNEKTSKKKAATKTENGSLDLVTENTKDKSLILFNKGKSIAEIAAERNLAASTIEGHLAHFVSTGQLAINKVMDATKIETIQKAIQANTEEGLTPVKEALGEYASYSDLRFVKNHLRWLEEEENSG
jgi:hypothetical protein